MKKGTIIVNITIWLISSILVFTGVTLPFEIHPSTGAMILNLGLPLLFIISPLVTLATAMEIYDRLLAYTTRHVTGLVEDEKVSWSENVLLTWVCFESKDQEQRKWFLMQCRKLPKVSEMVRNKIT